MDWKDLEKLTVLKLREEALKYPQIEGVHGKNKEQLLDEIAKILGIERPHGHFTETIVHTKSDLKHRIRELKSGHTLLRCFRQKQSPLALTPCADFLERRRLS